MTQIPILGIDSKEFKVGFWDSCKHTMGMLLTITKTEEKQVFYPWLDKLTMVYTNVEFTLTKKVMLHQWNPRTVYQPRWAQKDQYPFIETAGRMAVPGAGGGDVGLLFNGYKFHFVPWKQLWKRMLAVAAQLDIFSTTELWSDAMVRACV